MNFLNSHLLLTVTKITSKFLHSQDSRPNTHWAAHTGMSTPTCAQWYQWVLLDRQHPKIERRGMCVRDVLSCSPLCWCLMVWWFVQSDTAAPYQNSIATDLPAPHVHTLHVDHTWERQRGRGQTHEYNDGQIVCAWLIQNTRYVKRRFALIDTAELFCNYVFSYQLPCPKSSTHAILFFVYNYLYLILLFKMTSWC